MNQSKDRPYSECELIGTHLMNGNICDRCGWKKPEPNPHDNKARDEPKTELPDLDEILEPFIDDLVRRITSEYTNPVGNEQLRQDIDAVLLMKGQAIAAIQAHIDKARLDELGEIVCHNGKAVTFIKGDAITVDERYEELEARLKSDKDKSE